MKWNNLSNGKSAEKSTQHFEVFTKPFSLKELQEMKDVFGNATFRLVFPHFRRTLDEGRQKRKLCSTFVYYSRKAAFGGLSPFGYVRVLTFIEMVILFLSDKPLKIPENLQIFIRYDSFSKILENPRKSPKIHGNP